MPENQRAMLWGYLYSAGFDARETRRLDDSQARHVYETQARRSAMTSAERFVACQALSGAGLIERRDGRWAITEAGRAALASEAA